MWSVPCEAVFNNHPDVYRSALVGVGPAAGKTPVIIIEPLPGRYPTRGRTAAFTKELLKLGSQNELTRNIQYVLFHRSFPVDVRHNAKINSEALAIWAARFVP